jgi:hypothetical protein
MGASGSAIYGRSFLRRSIRFLGRSGCRLDDAGLKHSSTQPTDWLSSVPARMLLLTSYSSGGGERTYEYNSHKHGTITTWPPHKGFAGLLGRNQKGFSEQGGLDRSFFVELNAANVTGCFLVFARSAPVLTVTSQLSLKEFLTRELLRSSRSARHFSVANWDRPSDSSQVLCVLPVPFQRCASDVVRFVQRQALGESMTLTSWPRLARQQLDPAGTPLCSTHC